MDTRERIIENAFSQFLSKGYISVEINQILNDLSITSQDFNNHFSDKEDLLRAVVERYYLYQLDTMTRITKGAQNFEDFISGIKLLIDEQVDILYNIESNESSCNLMMDTVTRVQNVKKDMSDLYINTFRNIRLLIEKCVQQGEIKKDIESSMLSLQLFTQLEGVYLTCSFNNKKLHKQEVFNTFDKIYNSVKYAS